MIDPVSPVAHYFKMQKRVKHIEARKKKLLKELRRDQKNMAKIGEKIGGKKQKIAMLEMEIRMSKLGLNVDESPKLGRHVKRRKSRNVQQGGICPPDTGSQSKIVAAEVSNDPNGGIKCTAECYENKECTAECLRENRVPEACHQVY